MTGAGFLEAGVGKGLEADLACLALSQETPSSRGPPVTEAVPVMMGACAGSSAPQQQDITNAFSSTKLEPQQDSDNSHVPASETAISQRDRGVCASDTGQQQQQVTSAATSAAVLEQPEAGEGGTGMHRMQGGKDREELIGRELYITASMLNHSCRPNCLVVRSTGRSTVVAQDSIKVRRSPRPIWI